MIISKLEDLQEHVQISGLFPPCRKYTPSDNSSLVGFVSNKPRDHFRRNNLVTTVNTSYSYSVVCESRLCLFHHFMTCCIYTKTAS